MRQVHVAHQAEHQGEAACDQEIEPSQGEAVQEGVHEGLLAADGVLQPFRPDGEDEPEEDPEGDENDERPEAVALDELPHSPPARRGPRPADAMPAGGAEKRVIARSEEHTSELQSLMRISYAVLCLKIKIIAPL